jgi:hypothetical protein
VGSSGKKIYSFLFLFKGLGIGAIFGIFTASVDPMYTINPQKIPTMKEIALEMRNRAWSTGKNFALIGMLFSVYECNIETYRGKSDLWNGFLGGFCTGGTLGKIIFVYNTKVFYVFFKIYLLFRP